MVGPFFLKHLLTPLPFNYLESLNLILLLIGLDLNRLSCYFFPFLSELFSLSLSDLLIFYDTISSFVDLLVVSLCFIVLVVALVYIANLPQPALRWYVTSHIVQEPYKSVLTFLSF